MKKIFIFFCIFFTFFSCESKKTSKEMYQYDLSKGRKNVEDNSYSSSYKNGTINERSLSYLVVSSTAQTLTRILQLAPPFF